MPHSPTTLTVTRKLNEDQPHQLSLSSCDASQLSQHSRGSDCIFFVVVENVISMRLDGRGGALRGDDFRYELYRQLGTKEIDDQITGAQ